MIKDAREQQGKIFEVAYFRFWNESAKDSELWDLFSKPRPFMAAFFKAEYQLWIIYNVTTRELEVIRLRILLPGLSLQNIV